MLHLLGSDDKAYGAGLIIPRQQEHQGSNQRFTLLFPCLGVWRTTGICITCRCKIIFYIIYPLSNIVKPHCLHYQCYTDDIQIYMQYKDTDVDIQESITRLQNCILEISNRMMVNSLKITGDKTDLIIFGNKPATYIKYSLIIGSNIS